MICFALASAPSAEPLAVQLCHRDPHNENAVYDEIADVVALSLLTQELKCDAEDRPAA